MRHRSLNRKAFLVSRYLRHGYTTVSFTVTIALSMGQAALRVLYLLTDLTLKTTIRSRAIVPIL